LENLISLDFGAINAIWNIFCRTAVNVVIDYRWQIEMTKAMELIIAPYMRHLH